MLFSVVLKAQNVETDTISTSAKDTLFTKNVNIIRAYTPTIKDAGKINTLPEIEKPQPIKSDIKYSQWTSPLTTDFDLQTLPSATLKRMRQQKELREGYAKLGVGNYSSFLGDFYVPLMKRTDYSLDFSMKHLSTFGKVKINDSTKVKAENMINSAQLSFTKSFYNIDLFSEINFSRNDFNYYGSDSVYVSPPIDLMPGEVSLEPKDLKPEDEAHNFFNINVGISSKPKIGGMKYAASLKYDLTNTASGLSENLFTTKGYLKSNLEKDEYGVDISLEHLSYKIPDSTILYFHDANDAFTSYSIFGLSPYYLLQKTDLNVRLGFKAFFSFNKGRAAYACPDVMANLTLVRDLFYLYGGVTGDLKTSSMQSLFKENRYVRPDIHLDELYTPLDAYAGIKFKLFEDLILNGFLGYKYIDNQYFFVNRQIADSVLLGYNNTFDVVYDKVGLFNTGASLTYNRDKKISALLKVTYNKWDMKDQAYAWHKPKWETDFDLNYKINDDIKISLNAFVLGKRYAPIYNQQTATQRAVVIDPIFDCSLEGVYEYNSWLYFFLKLNNIFAQDYQTWYGYNAQRFNAMAGVMLSF